MKALITGASSGIGADIAKELSNMGYDIILVARRKTRLTKIKSELKTNAEIIKLDMIDTNIKGLHILTKLFLQEFTKRNRGYILNVASAAAFQPGPLMAGYYATKAYVLRLSESIYGELREIKSNVGVSVLCPGPVDTEFNKVAKVKFSIKQMKSQDVAKYGFLMKLNYCLNRFVPKKLLLKICYNIQLKKEG